MRVSPKRKKKNKEKNKNKKKKKEKKLRKKEENACMALNITCILVKIYHNISLYH